MTIPVVIAGGNGRMGRALAGAVLDDPDLHLVAVTLAPGGEPLSPLSVPKEQYTPDLEGALRSARVLIDFTAPASVAAHGEACERQQCAWVLGTTGLSAAQQRRVNDVAQRVPVCQAANFSRGVTLLLDLLEQLGSALDEATDVEIIEAHHRHKRDAPSGTALAMGEAVARGRGAALAELREVHAEGLGDERRRGAIGFATVRAGDIVGEHTALFAADGERLEITHRAGSRRAFASGACSAARWLHERAPGLYTMRDVLGLHDEE